MSIDVRGIPEVQRNLSAFPRLLVLQCFRKALSRAAGVFEEELRRRAPETDYSTSSDEYGHLVDNIMSTVTLDTQARGGGARVSFGDKTFVAYLVEFGHRMVTHKGKQVGDVAPHPFIRAAFESAADRALEVFTEEVQATLGDIDITRAA